MIYQVTKKTPTKVVSQEFWLNHLKAKIRRDIINSQCDEYCGAILEVVNVLDLSPVNTMLIDDIKLYEQQKSAYENESVEIMLSDKHFIMVDIVNNGKPLNRESDWGCDCFRYCETDVTDVWFDFEPSAEVLNEMNGIISLLMHETVVDYYNEEIDLRY